MKRIKACFLGVCILGIFQIYGYSWSYDTSKYPCPICSQKNRHIFLGEMTSPYIPLSHVPFAYEYEDRFAAYHCVRCRFTCFRFELFEIYKVNHPSEKCNPQDLKNAKDSLDEFDFSSMSKRYKAKILPKYKLYEIIERIYLRGFTDAYYTSETGLFSDRFFAKFYTVMGLAYHDFRLYDRASITFKKALSYLKAYKQTYNGKFEKGHPNRTNFLFFCSLYEGTLNYFLGHEKQAIDCYEQGMKKLYEKDYLELFRKNCFYLNSDHILGPFLERPITYIYRIRNIYFMRYFNMPFDWFLLSLLYFWMLMGLWFATAKTENNHKFYRFRYAIWIGTLLISIATIGYITFSFSIHFSFRSMLLVYGFWSASLFAAKLLLKRKDSESENFKRLFSGRYRIVYHCTLALPWIMFFSSNNMHKEIERLFWINPFYYDQVGSWIDFTFKTLPIWVAVAAFVLLVHYFVSYLSRREKPGLVSSIFPTILSIAPFIISVFYAPKELGSELPNWYFALVGTVWFILIQLLDYRILRPLQRRFHLLNRLSYSFRNRFWPVTKFSFFIFPAIFFFDSSQYKFELLYKFLPFWVVVTFAIFLLHVSMAHIFKSSRYQTDYSVLITILSGLLIYYSMRLYDSDLMWNSGPSLHLILGILTFSLFWEYEYFFKHDINCDNTVPIFFEYFYFNSFWNMVKILYIVLPILYAIEWTIKSRIYLTNISYGGG